jgi:hypothetical protein
METLGCSNYAIAQPTLEQCFLALVKAFDEDGGAAIARSASFRADDMGAHD